MNQVFILIGSNIDPEKNIPRVLALLCSHNDLRLIHRSSVWRTSAVGTDSADFYNLAVHVETNLNHDDLKSKVLSCLEKVLGRKRTADKYAPRTIDLDIIIFNDLVADEELFRFSYLILPFAELLPDLIDPKTGMRLQDLGKQKLVEPSATYVALDFNCTSIGSVKKTSD